ncbi:MAG: dihydroneopterin aldolase [Limnohabitans sp.]|nr:dihydroneopterin aldolase [Limnohabitans sp.]
MSDLELTCRRLFLRGITIAVNIGIHDFEKTATQRIIFDVDLYILFQNSTAYQDDISEVVDYDFVRQVIHQRVAQGHINLQETLCDDVLTQLMSHKGVKAARVSTRKPDVYPDCEFVGVEAFRIKPN